MSEATQATELGSLCLSRKPSESVIIGGGLIEVIVARIRGDKVWLLFKAPKELTVHRAEVHDAIQRRMKLESSDNDQANGIQ